LPNNASISATRLRRTQLLRPRTPPNPLLRSEKALL